MTEPPQLDYQTPPPARPPIGALVGGLATALGASAVIGFVAVVAALDIHPQPAARRQIGPGLPLLGLALAAGVVLAVVLLKARSLDVASRRTARRYFWLGFLLGLSVCALLEGVCWSAIA